VDEVKKYDRFCVNIHAELEHWKNSRRSLKDRVDKEQDQIKLETQNYTIGQKLEKANRKIKKSLKGQKKDLIEMKKILLKKNEASEFIKRFFEGL